MKLLDSYSFPLQGASLIEASAGTGKTYTIVNLYLRLLLGHQCKPLTVDQILVVTFTNAATAELKERIRQRIYTAYLDFYLGSSDDEFIQLLINDNSNQQLACETLSLAAKQMDEAAVFTIHSFCQRMLSEHAFESGSVFDEQFELDESKWIRQAGQDYWRKYIAPLSMAKLEFIRDFWSSPELLLKALSPILHRQLLTSSVSELQLGFSQLDKLIEQTRQLKCWWQDERVSEQMQQAKFKGNFKLGKPGVYLQMDEFCQSDSNLCPFDSGWTDFFPEKVQKARSKTSPELTHINFERFEQLENLRVKATGNFKQALLYDGLQKIRANLADYKQQTHQLAPDDLMARLHAAVSSVHGEPLVNLIRTKFPAALIDEFQDTDDIQFTIFSQLYPLVQTQDSPLCLIMIGDPKQAIYAFRGADIFTYIEAKQRVDSQRHFTLATNWRSQPNMVEAVNQLFISSKRGFLFEQDIPFYPVQAASENAEFRIEQATQASLIFHHLVLDDECLSQSDARRYLSIHLANQLVSILAQGSVVVEHSGNAQSKPILAGDCCVLVRDRLEAAVIKQALSEANIDSVFLIRHSVFATDTAADVYRLLDAMVNPRDERKLKAALASGLMCHNASALEQLFNNELDWQMLVEQFVIWQQHWQRHGVMMALNQLLNHFDVFSRLLTYHPDGLRRLTDLRHLIELLQQQNSLTPSENQTLYWLGQQILNPDHANEAQQLRLETDANLVQIITMHTSKGLEFPLVFIPFACAYREPSNAIYHNDDQQLMVDFLAQPESMQKADHERLAEDIRLLYVALTRAVYHCFVGVWNPMLGRSKRQSALPLTAMGSLLISEPQQPDNIGLRQSIEALAERTDIGYQQVDVNSPSQQASIGSSPQHEHWQVAQLANTIARNWRITSYSAIARNQFQLAHEQPGTDEHEAPVTPAQAELSSASLEEAASLDRFQFTRGAQAGSFLHGVLENIDFQKPVTLVQVIEQQGDWYGIDPIWNPVVLQWLKDVLLTPIPLPIKDEPQSSLMLAQLSPQDVSIEMEFHMPLTKVKVKDFNRLINQYFSTTARNYQFEQLNGMLKGYIDLTFSFDGQYFVADYKSNYLGDKFKDYAEPNLQQAMVEHDYHLQSVLYILALHRMLSIKLADYQYDRHIGGAYYWFLRGMSPDHLGSGIYFIKPQKEFIEALDGLFYGNPIANDESETVVVEPSEPAQLGLW
ncbi:exodeoxyribonuclease V subunit beta [Aliiglaciecola sp. LCG003]|uniref:exodeoxyribonuclease V subunit beta n=1 Tax=Aliiglaciecola sp. LCG003 TaxID=3053655 RepID=UPI002573942B|nr:exodeoxyribonuclease V subunit beta [Aliiglaciecola sp. LCG003]WJG07929.1 exodeoxyribonuclease V subunit beta [Aliiglaciecola sp. LCG003]